MAKKVRKFRAGSMWRKLRANIKAMNDIEIDVDYRKVIRLIRRR